MARNSEERRIRFDSGSKSGTNVCGYLQAADSAFVTYRQLVTPFSATASQDGTAVCGLHADAEAVSFGAVAVVRLKRTFWHSDSCFLFLFLVWERQTASPPAWARVRRRTAANAQNPNNQYRAYWSTGAIRLAVAPESLTRSSPRLLALRVQHVFCVGGPICSGS